MATETLLDTAATTQTTAADAATPVIVATPAIAAEPIVAVTTQQPPAAEPVKAEVKTEPDAAKPAGAPEKYDFKAPEGQLYDEQVLSTYSAVAKELNLSQDAAQTMLDKVAPTIASRQVAQIEAMQTQWVDSAKADKEYGGEKLTENLGIAKKALDQFGTPELSKLLNESGMGNNPEVIRFFYRAGKAISEDKIVTGGAPTTGDTHAKSFYPNSDMK